MSLVYDASIAAVPQSGQWQCSAAASAWLLDALGIPTTQDDVVNALGPGRIDPSLGLHDASGAGLVAMLRDSYGVTAANGAIGFDDALQRASSGPLLLGGVGWNHWSGVRGASADALQLANPSPGYRGVGTTLSRDQFAQLGPFYAVWPTDVAAAPSGAPGAAGGLQHPPVWALVAGGLALAWGLDLL